MFKKISTMMIIIMLIPFLFSCKSDKEKQIKKEMNSFASFLSEGLSNEEIKISKKEYSENGIYLELFGSQSFSDIIDIISTCNTWIENNQTSVLISERKKIRVELYYQKPDNGVRESSGYSVRLSNYGIDYATEPENRLDVLDINQCEEFCTSYFTTLPKYYRVIMLPTSAVIDDFDVFLEMNNLRSLEFSDSPYDSDRNRIEALHQELADIIIQYDDIPFSVEVDDYNEPIN